MNLQLGWQEIGAIASVITIIGGIVYALLRGGLKSAFVDLKIYESAQADHDETLVTLTGRVGAIETRLERIPTHDDMARFSERLGRLEVASGRSETALDGVKEAMARVEHMLDLLVKFQMGSAPK